MACVEGEGSDIVVDSYEVVETEVVFEETSCSEDTDDELSRTSLHLLSESAPNLKQHLAEKVVEPRSFEQKMCVTPTSPINDDGKDRYSDSTESDVTSLAGTAKFTAICHDGENSSHTLGTTISGSLSLGECQSLLRLSSTNSFDSRSETEGTESEKVESENENSETGESDEPESEDETTENLADATIRQLTVTDRLDAPIHPQREESANLHVSTFSPFSTADTLITNYNPFSFLFDSRVKNLTFAPTNLLLEFRGSKKEASHLLTKERRHLQLATYKDQYLWAVLAR